MKKIITLLIFIAVLCCGCLQTETGVYEETVPIRADAVLASVAEGMENFIIDNYDAYFWYMDDEEYNTLMEDYYGEYSGIGVTMIFSKEDEYPLIASVNKDSPAQEAGITVGEYIKEVNGESVSGWSSELVASKIKGKAGTEVILTMIGTDGSERQVSITRRTIENYTAEERPIEDYPQIAYIAISSFSENTPAEFKALWQEINAEREIEGLIIDLRDNGGGSFPACLALAGYFIPEGEILVYQQTKNGMTHEVSEGGLSIDVPVVILQNEFSASASEVFLGAMLDYDRAVSVGMQSYGKGITQTIVTLLSGHGYRYTSSMYYTPSMFSLHGIGIAPDYEVYLSADCSYNDIYDANYEKDNQLAKAIELLTAQ